MESIKPISEYPRVLDFIEVAPRGCKVKLKTSCAVITLRDEPYKLAVRVEKEAAALLYKGELVDYKVIGDALKAYKDAVKEEGLEGNPLINSLIKDVVSSLSMCGWDILDEGTAIKIARFSS